MCNNMSGGELIDFLLNNGFSLLSYEDKCKLKNKRPTPPLNVCITEPTQKRTFQQSWYKKYPWLTGHSHNNKFYCYICLLFGGTGENAWCREGISTVKNFEKRASRHQISRRHILNRESFEILDRNGLRIYYVLSEAAHLAALKHNEQVKSNRKILARLIQSMVFLSKQELAVRGPGENETCSNKGNYLELLNFAAQEEQFLKDHLDSTVAFKATSPDIENDLIDVITCAVNEHIKKELEASLFVSVQADETLDVSCKSQINIIFRFCTKDTVEERCVGFFDVLKDKTARGLSNIILKVIDEWNVKDKLISQTYDGAALGAGTDGGVQRYVKQVCPNAIFLHSYAHQLNLVLLHGSKSIKEVRLFIANLFGFRNFFNKSSKRITLLAEKGFKLPEASSHLLNFHSRAVSTIKTHFVELNNLLVSIIEDENSEWDPDSLNGAIGLKRHLNNQTFIYLLSLYYQIFIFVDQLFNVLQSTTLNEISTSQTEIDIVLQHLHSLRKEETTYDCIQIAKVLNANLSYSETDKVALTKLTFEILDSQIVQMEIRFTDFLQLQFAELLNERLFSTYHKKFPKDKFELLLKKYPYFKSDQLENELSIIYADPVKRLPPLKLLKFLVDNGLDTVYEETTKLIRLLLTFPVTPASSERNASTLKRIKTYLRNSMTDERLSNLGTLAIEKQLVSRLCSDFNFVDHVIDLFAEKKDRCFELIYKKV